MLVSTSFQDVRSSIISKANVGAEKRVESLIAAARSAEHVLIFMQVKESQTEEEHQATHDFQAGLRH